MFPHSPFSTISMILTPIQSIKNNWSNLTSFLLRAKPSLLYRESATGRTPLDMSHDKYISSFISQPPTVENHWNYHPQNITNHTLSAYNAKTKQEETHDEPHMRIWEECLRVQGELKRKFDGGIEDEESKQGAGEGKRRLATLFEANEVAKRLAGSHNKNNGVGVVSDVMSLWM